MAEALIATAAGEFAPSFLTKEATKVGIKQFIQTYGSTAFRTVAPVITGGMIAEKVIEAYPPVDLQKEKLFGVPLNRITGQGEVYSDIEEPKKVEPLKYIDTVHGGKGPLKPIKAKGFPAETEVKKWDESFKAPEKIETNKGFEVPSQEKVVPPGFETPDIVDTSILTKDITQQTKDLVTKEPEFGALTEAEKQTALLEKGDKPDFYSRAIEAITNAKQDTYTKGKWKSIVKGNTTKDEMDYLGLTKLLEGKESITKQELLKLVKDKDIASGMTVKSIPKDQMNPMYYNYSLGFEKSGTQEHIVFQIGKDKGEVGQLYGVPYKEPHFDTEYGTGTFAHARVQVGFGDSDAPPADYEHLDSKVFDKFDNTLIIDEIQSQWIQEGQDKGFESDFKVYRGDKIPEELEELVNKTGTTLEDQHDYLEDQYYVFNKTELVKIADSDELAYEVIENQAVPDLPIKDSKKYVELVLNEMIRKAVKDGRDSVAITNGQIQYNRYEAMGEKERQGLKKFYDTFVYDQLNKIAKNYNVELEKIDITSNVATKEEEDNYLDQSLQRALDAKYTLQKITFQELWDRIKDTNIPEHAALYSNEGRGQGGNYIEEYLTNFHSDWNKIRNNEVYVWKETIPSQHLASPSVDKISWELPIVIRSHAVNHAPELQDNDLELYRKYLKDLRPSPDKELKEEQLIKMKLPKKLQKEILKKPIRLTKKINEQTQRLVA